MTKRKIFRNLYCMQCGEILSVSSKSKYCTAECAGKMRKSRPRSENDEIAESLRATRLLRLYAELDRCSTHWERAKIKAEIEQIK